MRTRINNSVRLIRKLNMRVIAFVGILLSVVIAFGVFIFTSMRSEDVLAKSCDSSYVLDWKDSNTYTVTCGSVNSAQWTVKNDRCSFTSPEISVDGAPGSSDRTVEVTIRINQSGNLDQDDTAKVSYIVDGVIQDILICPGDSLNNVFIVTRNIQVPVGGTYQIGITLENDSQNEVWQVKDGDITACLLPADPLPITLINFSGEFTPAKHVKLKWETSTETNNDHFILESSSDGVNFDQLGTVNGSGTSSIPNSYKFTDKSPFNGINYYRLKASDLNGSVTTIETIPVNANFSDNIRPDELIISPNPFSENFSVAVESDSQQEVMLRVVDLSGAVIHNQIYSIDSGVNKLNVSVNPSAGKGMYSVQLVGEKGSMIGSAKAVKQ